MKVDRKELMVRSWKIVRTLGWTISAAMKFTWKRIKEELSKASTVVVAPAKKSYKELVRIIMNNVGGSYNGTYN